VQGVRHDGDRQPRKEHLQMQRLPKLDTLCRGPHTLRV
jgi:hypothetical protein